MWAKRLIIVAAAIALVGGSASALDIIPVAGSLHAYPGGGVYIEPSEPLSLGVLATTNYLQHDTWPVNIHARARYTYSFWQPFRLGVGVTAGLVGYDGADGEGYMVLEAGGVVSLEAVFAFGLVIGCGQAVSYVFDEALADSAVGTDARGMNYPIDLYIGYRFRL